VEEAAGVSARRLLGAAAVVCAVAVACVLALLARDVQRTADSVSASDRRFEITKPDRDVWTSANGVGARVARDVLGANDDLQFRRAVAIFARSQATHVVLRGNPGEVRAEATIALERFDKNDHDRMRRARTANMLGIMAFQDALDSQSNQVSLLERSGEMFRRAIALDPANEAAKFNLELLLQLDATSSGPFAIRSGGAAGGSGAISGAKPQGHGY
jgi:hypothetical protein